MQDTQYTGMEIAIIGMAGRFPGADNLNQFWQNLENGVESVTFLTDDQLNKNNADPSTIQEEGFVKSGGGILEGKEQFDAGFFGYTPVEAETLDPQTRIFLETAWHALEDAGYNSEDYEGLIGLYGGSGWNLPWEVRVHFSQREHALGNFASFLLANRDNLCTLTSYKLGLKGPSVYLKTTCSTSLVAVHVACQSILNGECEMALAGGVTAGNIEKTGYIYKEGMINSPDGHCRAFDANAKGTIPGEGTGIVVLKRLEDAIQDKDFIHAIIKGTAINNDGSRKIGYTAPSITGQVDVIREAFQVADVEPRSIAYIETHGTGTPVGDPIEVEALKTAFDCDEFGFCRLGSVKTNFGHLDAAAGIVGLIKTVLILKHRVIPPSLHFQTPNPKIDFENSPFRVNNELFRWQPGEYPFRCGVSSLGIGGTNAHVILEEWVPDEDSEKTESTGSLLMWSARSQTALDQMTGNLVSYLEENPEIDLSRVAYTLQTGRKSFQYRRMLLCKSNDADEATKELSNPDSRKVQTATVDEENENIVFMFPGLGSDYIDMGRHLYQAQPLFREPMDRCFDILKTLVTIDIKERLYPGLDTDNGNVSDVPQQTADKDQLPEISQIVTFIFEYALAQLLMNLGITPRALVGYSFGEYAAACIAGVFSLEDALKIIVMRSRLIQQAAPGAMVSVPLVKDQLLPHLENNLALAVDNGPSCIVSGPPEAMDAFVAKMKQNRVICVPLTYARRAIHSHMMTPILETFKKELSQFTFNKPQIPFVSNLTGQWVDAQRVVTPDYWADHLEQTVCFADAVKLLLNNEAGPGDPLFIEVGPGYDLSVLIRHHLADPSKQCAVHLVENQQGKSDSHLYLLGKLGRLWLSGVSIDWKSYYGDNTYHRLPLPLYPFQHSSYWPESNLTQAMVAETSTTAQETKKSDLADWFYVPTWKRSLPRKSKTDTSDNWLVFADSTGVADAVVQKLTQQDRQVTVVSLGESFGHTPPNRYTVDPAKPEDYRQLFEELSRNNHLPNRILHCWSVTGDADNKEKPIDYFLDTGFYSLFHIALEAGKQVLKDNIQIAVLSDHLHRITGDESLEPGKAAILGAVKVIPREFFNISCRAIDIVSPEAGSPAQERLVQQILQEFQLDFNPQHQDPRDAVVAYRGAYRWNQEFEPQRIEALEQIPETFKEGGVYLITGGLGGLGMVLAEHLGARLKAKLVLTQRSPFPSRDDWQQWCDQHDADDPTAIKIKRLLEIEKSGAKVLTFSAEAADPQQMKDVIQGTLNHYGTINGIIHAAGIPDGGVMALRTRETIKPIMAPKIDGVLLLDRLVKEFGISLDFMVLYSSIDPILGIFGQVAYSAANAFLDAFAHYKTHQEGTFTVAINWDFWKETGMGVASLKRLQQEQGIEATDIASGSGMRSAQGVEAFERLLNAPHPQVVVSTEELGPRMARVGRMFSQGPGGTASEGNQKTEPPQTPGKLYPRPQLTTDYVAPESEFQQTFAQLLQTYFGFQQVGIDDNLFEYGITSLDMIHINNSLKEKTGADIPIVVMFEYPTIRSLDKYLQDRRLQDDGLTSGSEETETRQDLEETEDMLHSSIELFDNFE